MTALPALLPAGIAACMVAAGVCGAVGVASAWFDWRERRRGARDGAERPAGGPNSPRRHRRRVGALYGPHSASCARETGAEAVSGPQGPATATDPPAPQSDTHKPADARTDPMTPH